MLILRDEHGRYYLLPRAILEQARADEAQQAELAAALDGQDTAGFAFPAVGLLFAVAPFTAPAGAGKVSVQDFHFVMKVNKASPTPG